MRYADWHVGMKVVCLKEGGWVVVSGVDHGQPKPKHGEICTISRLDAIEDTVFIGCAGYDDSTWFWAGHFRKIQPRKTDISIFEAILHGARVPEDA